MSSDSNIMQIKQEIIDEIPKDLESKVKSEINLEEFDVPEPVFVDCSGFLIKEENVKNEEQEALEFKQSNVYSYSNFLWNKEDLCNNKEFKTDEHNPSCSFNINETATKMEEFDEHCDTDAKIDITQVTFQSTPINTQSNDSTVHDASQIETKCHFCPKTFLHKLSLDDHTLKKHKNLIKDNIQQFVTSKLHKCSKCTFTTVYTISLQQHLIKVHTKTSKLDLKCQFCGEEFLRKHVLDYHLFQKHHEHIKQNLEQFITTKIHKCSLCEYATIYKSALSGHLATNHNESKISCQFCEKIVSNKRALDYHLLQKHNDEIKNNLEEFVSTKIHKCLQCAYQTTRKSSLKSHLALIHNESKISCEFCDKTFVAKQTLDDHMLKQHKDDIKSDAITCKIHKCSTCNYQTTSRNSLNVHLSKVHNEYQILCPFCDKTSAQKATLDDHLLKQHRERIKNHVGMFISSKVHKCPKCPYETTIISCFKKHMRKKSKH